MEDKENHQAENELFEVKRFIINMTAGLYEAELCGACEDSSEVRAACTETFPL